MKSIKIENVTANYGSKTIISSLFFELTCNKFYILVGNNGIGKSTFLKCLNSNIPYQGSIIFPDNNYKIAYLSQKIHTQFDLKVIDLVVMGCVSNGAYGYRFSNKEYLKALEKLTEIGIKDLKDEFYSQLSGGEQQLVWIAFMLVQNADLYILDEPLQNLDLKNRKIVLDILYNIHQKNKATIILSCHELSLLENYPLEIIHLSNSKLASFSSDKNSINSIENILVYG